MPHRKKDEQLKFGDRFVTALLGGMCAFATMCAVWFIVMYAGGRSGTEASMPFYCVWIVTGVVAILAFMAGPERTMDTFESAWSLMGRALFWNTPRSDHPTRKRKR